MPLTRIFGSSLLQDIEPSVKVWFRFYSTIDLCDA
jgi:hypothetical protein